MRILVTTDGSERSLHVLPHAITLARACSADLRLLRVLDPTADVQAEHTGPPHTAIDQLAGQWKRELDSLLHESVADAQAVVGVTYKGEDVYKAILRIAHELVVDIAAMDSRGGGALRHALIGSVAMGVIGHSRLPVMVTGPSVRSARSTRARYHLVVANDGSRASASVLRALQPLFAYPRLKVTLMRLYVPTFADSGESAEMETCRAQLATLRARLQTSMDIQTDVTRIPEFKRIDTGVLERAEKLRASALALSTRGHSASTHLLAGSTALGILQQSPIPLILVRSGFQRPSVGD